MYTCGMPLYSEVDAEGCAHDFYILYGSQATGGKMRRQPRGLYGLGKTLSLNAIAPSAVAGLQKATKSWPRRLIFHRLSLTIRESAHITKPLSHQDHPSANRAVSLTLLLVSETLIKVPR